MPDFTPDEKYVSNLYAELSGREDMRMQNSQVQRMRDVRELTVAVNLPQEYRLVPFEIKDPTATDEIERIVSTLTAHWPKCNVTPADDTNDEQVENATLRERWTMEVLRKAGEREDGTHTLVNIVDAMAGDGGGWSKFYFKNDRWYNRWQVRRSKYKKTYIDDDGEEIEEVDEDAYRTAKDEVKKEAGVPFVWEHVDVMSVYPIFGGGKIVEVIEATERSYTATMQEYQLARNSTGKFVPIEQGEPAAPRYAAQAATRPNSILVLEYWNEKYCMYVVVGKDYDQNATAYQVKSWAHGYGRVPYFYAPGKTMNHWRNRKVGWSVSESKRFLVEYRSFLWTLHAQVAARDSLPPLQSVVVDQALALQGNDKSPKLPPRWKPLDIYENPPGREIKPIEMPQISQALREEIALVSQAIEKLEAPRVRSEIGGGVEGAGFAISQLLSEANVRHAPLVRSLIFVLNQITRFMWHLTINKVGETVWAHAPTAERSYRALKPKKTRAREKTDWIGLGPNELKAPVEVSWDLDPERPSAKLIEARYWHERVNAKTASSDQAIEAMGDNPDEVRRGIAIDEIRATPWYKQRRLHNLVQSRGAGDTLQEAIAQQIAQTGIVPGAPQQMGSMAGAQGSAPAPGQVGQGPNNTPGGMGTQIVPDMGQAAARGNLPTNPGGGTGGAPQVQTPPPPP